MERRCGVLYQLMNKDKVVATYEEEKRLDDYRYTEIERLDGYVPCLLYTSPSPRD